MIDKLDEYSLKLMQSIYNGSQPDSLKFAADIRRTVLREKLKGVRDQVEISDILAELNKLSNIFPKEEDKKRSANTKQ